MTNITMVKYTAEQIDSVLSLLNTIAMDSKAYDCSIQMMSAVLDINNFLRENAIIFEEGSEIPMEKEPNDIVEDVVEEEESQEIILNGGGANG